MNGRDAIAAAKLDPLGPRDVLKSGGVVRYHSEHPRDVPHQSLADHQWRCAVIARGIWPSDVHLIAYLTVHDVHEYVIGDVPSPIKGLLPPGVFDDAEDEVERQLFGAVLRAVYSPEVLRRAKAVDMLECYLYCSEIGTPRAKVIADTALSYLQGALLALPPGDSERVRHYMKEVAK